MTDAFATERPKLLSLFGQAWADHPPWPQYKPKPKQRPPVHALTLYESVFTTQSRSRPEIGAYALADLADGNCRYPHGDGPFLFCGATAQRGCSYCAQHARECFRVR